MIAFNCWNCGHHFEVPEENTTMAPSGGSYIYASCPNCGNYARKAKERN